MTDHVPRGEQRGGLAAARRRLLRLRDWFHRSFLGRWWLRLLEVEFVDRAVALAAKGFVSLFPAVVAVASFVPQRARTGISASLQRRMGLSGESLEAVEASLGSGAQVRASTGFIGLLLLLFYATSFTTALQRLYLRAWRRPPRAQLTKYVTGLGWLAGVIVLAALFGSLRRVFVGAPGTLLYGVLLVATTAGMWWITSYFMLQRQVRWRVLLAPSVVMAVGGVVYGWAAAIWVPRYLLANEEQFGFFGVSMTLVSWFVGLGFLAVAATSLGPVLAEDPGPVGRLVRGREATALRPGAPPGLPPPAYVSLLDALARPGEPRP